KGLDFEEAALSGSLAAALWYGRSAFDVHHERLRMRAVLLPLAAVATTMAVAAVISVWLAGGTDPSVHIALRETGALLTWRPGTACCAARVARWGRARRSAP